MTKQKLTPEERAAIRERVEKATHIGTKVHYDHQVLVRFFNFSPEQEIVADIYKENDAEFYYNARTDVPALLSHIEAVEAELDHTNKLLANTLFEFNAVLHNLDQQKALVERLRAASIAIDTWSLVIESAVRRDVSPDTHNSVLAAIKANREALALIAEQAAGEGE